MKTVTLRRRVLATFVIGLLFVGALLLTGCGSTTGASTSNQGMVAASGEANAGSGGSAGIPALTDSSAKSGSPSAATVPSSVAAMAADATRLVVRTVSMRLKVEDVDKTARAVAKLAGAYQGYVESMQVSTEAGGPIYAPESGSSGSSQSQGGSTALAGYVTVRIPARSLEKFRTEVAGLGKVLYEATDSQDVTAEHADLQARLKNLEATEAGLRRLFDKAKTVSEMLAIQEQLTQVQGQIESLTAIAGVAFEQQQRCRLLRPLAFS